MFAITVDDATVISAGAMTVVVLNILVINTTINTEVPAVFTAVVGVIAVVVVYGRCCHHCCCV